MLVLKALSWQSITKSLTISIPFSETMKAFAQSILGRYIPGKVFFVLSRIEPYGPDKKNLGTASFGMMIEFCLEFCANFVILLFCCLLTNAFSEYKMALIVCSSVTILMLINPKLHLWLFKACKSKFPDWIHMPSLPWNVCLWPLVLMLLSWSVYLSCIYIFIQAWLNIELSQLLYIGVYLGFSSVIGTLAVFSPGGLGIREGVFTTCLLSLGLSLEDAWTIASLARVCLWVGELAFVLFSFLMVILATRLTSHEHHNHGLPK